MTHENCNDCLRENCCCLTIHEKKKEYSILKFFYHTKSLIAAAIGIELLCITAAEIGENTGLYLFGFNIQGIVIAYMMGYGLAGFTTFVTILGRYDLRNNSGLDTCCSLLELYSKKSFFSKVLMTFRNFAIGSRKLPKLLHQPNMKHIVKTSLIILFTAESACILTAETVDLIFYKYSILLSIPLALLAGSFTVVAPEAYKRLKKSRI